MYNLKKKNDMKAIDMILRVNMAIALLLSLYLSSRYNDKDHDIAVMFLVWNSAIIAAYLYLKKEIGKRHPEWFNE